MAKAPKRLEILVSTEIAQWPEILKLKEQGHEVSIGEDQWSPQAFECADLILGPRCHRMDESIRKHFPEAIAEARRIKYPKDKA